MPVVEKLNNTIKELENRSLNLLLSNDHPLIANIEKLSLTKAGFKVKLAPTPSEMLNILSNENIDVVIIDFHFYKGQGVLEIERAKKISQNPRVKFIVTSVLGHEEVKSRSYSLMSDLFLLKPAPRHQMITEIKKLANQTFRKYERIKCKIPFIVTNNNKRHDTLAIDISSEGAHLLDKKNNINPHIGLELTVEFFLPDYAEIIKARGVVVRITEEGFGLKFQEISSQSKNKIEKYIFSNSIEVRSTHYYL